MAEGRVYKKMTDFKAAATAEEISNDKGAMIIGSCEVRDGMMVIGIPLHVTGDQCRWYSEKVQQGSGTVTVDKGGLVVAIDIPEGLELAVSDPETGDCFKYRVKRGGVAARRYFNLGFDPTKGYRSISVPVNANVESSFAPEAA